MTGFPLRRHEVNQLKAGAKHLLLWRPNNLANWVEYYKAQLRMAFTENQTEYKVGDQLWGQEPFYLEQNLKYFYFDDDTLNKRWLDERHMTKQLSRWHFTIKEASSLSFAKLTWPDVIRSGFPEGPETCGPCELNCCEKHPDPEQAFIQEYVPAAYHDRLRTRPPILHRLLFSVDNL